MNELPDKNAGLIADLLNRLADVSGEAVALAAYRREADAFDPDLSTALVALDLLSIADNPAGSEEVRACLKRLQEDFQARGSLAAAEKIVAALKKNEGAERRP